MIGWDSYAWVLTLIAGGVCLSGVLQLWKRRRELDAMSLILLMAAMGVWSVSYALMLKAPNLDGKVLLVKVSTLGAAAIPPGVLLLTLCYAGYEKWASGRNYLLLLALWALVVSLSWTTETHRLVVREFWLEPDSQVLRFKVGPGFWSLFIFYPLLLISFCAALLWKKFPQVKDDHRLKIVLLVIALAVPSLSTLVYFSGLIPPNHPDPTPFLLIVPGFLFTYGLFHQEKFDSSELAADPLAIEMNFKLRVARAMMAVIVPIFFVFTFAGVFRGDHLVAGLLGLLLSTLVVAFLLTLSAPSVRRQDLVIKIAIAVTLLLLGAIIIAYTVGRFDTTRTPWIFIFPVLAIFGFGSLRGLLATGLFAAVLLLASSYSGRPEAAWLSEIGLRSLLALFVVTFLAFQLERKRVAAIRQVFDQRDALAESERRYRDLFHGINDLVCTHDAEGRLLSVNRSMAEALGLRPEEMIGRPIAEFVPPKHRQAVYDEYLPRVRRDKMAEGVLSVVAKDGRKHYFEYRNYLVQREGGEPFISSVARDITERVLADREMRRMEEELSQARKAQALGTLAGGIAHDFNNILAAVMGYTELALDNLPPGNENRRHLEEVLKASHRARGLVGQILAFSRHGRAERRLVRLGPIIEDGLKKFRDSLPPNIEVRNHLQIEARLVLADVSQVHQVLVNLCANAAQAMGEKGGLLEVSLEEVEVDGRDEARQPDLAPGVYVRLRVRDTGHGIAPQVLDRIFDPYFTTRGPEEGSGLGLAVAQGIVKSHGGAIEVESRQGQGTTFDVYLPSLGRGPDEQRLVEVVKSTPTGRERILVVDDEASLADIGRRALERLGYQVISQTSSLAALDLFRARPDEIDLVITDQTMPLMTGVQLAREMLKIRPDLPIILCTGFSEQVSGEQTGVLGIRRFLMKPLVSREIAEVVRSALDEPARARAAS